MEIRPMRAEDIEPLIDVCATALWTTFAETDRPRQRNRIGHLLQTDPGGAWVAEHAGAPVGCSMALLREGIWGLSLLAVLDEHRGSGAGRELVAAALTHGEGSRGAIILSSEHPAAMRTYARAGFDLRPAVSLAGIPANRPAAPAIVRDGSQADGPWMDDVARHVRGAGYGSDVACWLEFGSRLRCVEERGWMVTRGGDVQALLARDEAAAVALLESHLADATDSVQVDFLTAGQDWAVQTGLAAGLALSPDGPVFTRGELGTLRPWVPSGAYL
jgi:GNAT superfamily N-acetyltransferase